MNGSAFIDRIVNADELNGRRVSFDSRESAGIALLHGGPL
jgi:hypothetical protein